MLQWGKLPRRKSMDPPSRLCSLFAVPSLSRPSAYHPRHFWYCRDFCQRAAPWHPHQDPMGQEIGGPRRGTEQHRAGHHHHTTTTSRRGHATPAANSRGIPHPVLHEHGAKLAEQAVNHSAMVAKRCAWSGASPGGEIEMEREIWDWEAGSWDWTEGRS